MGAQRRIIFGVTGGIAAYKAPMIARLLRAAGQSVHFVPTKAALKMIGAPTLAAISGHHVHTSVFDDPEGVEHVQLGAGADALLIAPATANTIAKLASGQADNLLLATALVATCPVIIAPAMHSQMWCHPATRANIATLKQRGVIVIEPGVGRLTGSDSGVGRLEEPEVIAERVLGLWNQELAGTKVLVTAGGTREALDPVRYLGNRSTGAMGIEIARAAANAGADVELIACNIERALPDGVGVTRVVSAADLADAVEERKASADVIIMTAAVADYRPVQASEAKLKKDGGSLTIELEENPDILASLTADRSHDAYVVGFAAETGDGEISFEEYGRQKALRKQADLLCINHVGTNAGFGDVESEILMVDADGVEVGRISGEKSLIAKGIISQISSVLKGIRVEACSLSLQNQ